MPQEVEGVVQSQSAYDAIATAGAGTSSLRGQSPAAAPNSLRLICLLVLFLLPVYHLLIVSADTD